MEQRIGIERMEEAIDVFGSFDENIRTDFRDMVAMDFRFRRQPNVFLHFRLQRILCRRVGFCFRCFWLCLCFIFCMLHLIN